VETGELLTLHFFFFFLEYFGFKWLAIFEEVPEDTRQFVGDQRWVSPANGSPRFI